MNKGFITRETIDEIANAIRIKRNETDVYYPYEMPEKIMGISGGAIGNYSMKLNDDGETVDLYCISDIPFKMFYLKSMIKNIELSESVKNIGVSAFYGSNGLTELNFPYTLDSIKETAFANCQGLTKILIDSKTIENNAFDYCDNLLDISIGENIEYIGDYAFYRRRGSAENATYITIYATTPPQIGQYIFNVGTAYATYIYVPDESVDLYKSEWTEYSEIIYPISEKEIDI